MEIWRSPCASRRPDRPDYEQEERYETNRYATAEHFVAAQWLPEHRRRFFQQHPRIGCVDVIPFIPVRDCTIQEADQLAREIAQEAALLYGQPFYLYEKLSLIHISEPTRPY